MRPPARSRPGGTGLAVVPTGQFDRAVAQLSMAYAQRAANRQPAIAARAPAAARDDLRARGGASPRATRPAAGPRVYGCRGLAITSAVGPVSTISPA